MNSNRKKNDIYVNVNSENDQQYTNSDKISEVIEGNQQISSSSILENKFQQRENPEDSDLFVSQKSLKAQRKRHLAHLEQKLAHSKGICYTNIFCIFCIQYSLFELGYQIFMQNRNFKLKIVDYVSDFAWVLCILLRLYYLREKNTSVHPISTSNNADINRKYTDNSVKCGFKKYTNGAQQEYIHSSRFSNEIVSVIPLELFAYMFAGNFRYLVIFKMLRFWRLVCFQGLISDIDKYMAKNSPNYVNKLPLVVLAMLLLTMSHYFGCIFYFTAITEARIGVQQTWLSEDGLIRVIDCKNLENIGALKMDLDLATANISFTTDNISTFNEGICASADDKRKATHNCTWWIGDTINEGGLSDRVKYIRDACIESLGGHGVRSEEEDYIVKFRYSLFECWIRSIYWSAICLVTVGFGDIIPYTMSETVVSMLCMYGGIFIATIIVGAIADMVSVENKTVIDFESRMDFLKKYMKKANLPKSISDRIHDFYLHSFDQLNGIDEEAVVATLPKPLQMHISKINTKALLSQVAFFRKASAALIPQVAHRLQTMVFSPNDVIVLRNRISNGLYCINRGVAQVLAKTDVVVGKLYHGAPITENALFSCAEEFAKVESSIRALTFVELVYLSREDFTNLPIFDVTSISYNYDECERVKSWISKVQRRNTKKKKMSSKMMNLMSVRKQSSNQNFLPNSAFRMFWELLNFTNLYAWLILLFLQIADTFTDRRNYGIMVCNLILDFYFFTDFVLNWRYFAFNENGVAITNPDRIRKHYIDTWFYYDLIAILPLDILAEIAHFNKKVIVAVSINKLARIVHLPSNFHLLDRILARHTTLGVAMRQIIKTFAVALLFLHSVACVWLMIGDLSIEWVGWNDSWISNDAARGSRYLSAMYSIIVSMSTLGYGDVVATNPVDTAMSTIVVLIGGVLYPAAVGSMASLLQQLDAAATQFKENQIQLKSFFKYSNLSPELANRIELYNNYIWTQFRGVNEEEILRNIPQAQRLQIIPNIYKKFIDSYNLIGFLREISSDFTKALLCQLSPKIYIPGTKIIEQGECFCTEMFILESGMCKLSSQNGKYDEDLRPISSFGESNLLHPAPPSIHEVRSTTYVRCLSLSRDSFESVVIEFPKDVTSTCLEEIRCMHEAKLESQKRRSFTRNRRKSSGLRRESVGILGLLNIATIANDINEEEDALEMTASDWQHPDSVFRGWWNFSMVIFELINCWLIPYRICFISVPKYFIFDYCVDIIFAIDAYLSWSYFGILHDGRYWFSQSKIRDIYRQSARFTIDIISSPPYDILALILWAAGFDKNISFIMALLRLPKLARMYLLPGFIRWLDTRVVRGATAYALTKLLVWVIIVSHYSACLFYTFSVTSRTDEMLCSEYPESLNDCCVTSPPSCPLQDSLSTPLINESQCYATQLAYCKYHGTFMEPQMRDTLVGPTGDDVAFSHYTRSFNWALPSLVVVVIGDVVPVSSIETCYCFFAVLVGLIVNAAIIGSIADIVANLTSAEAIFRQKAANLERYMKHIKLSQTQIESVRNCLDYLVEEMDAIDYEAVISDLPQVIRREIRSHNAMGMIFPCPVFTKASPGFRDTCLLNLELIMFQPNDDIVSFGNLINAIYFIKSGSVNVMKGKTGIHIGNLYPGPSGYFELGWNDTWEYTLKAHTFCTLYCLERRAFRKMLEEFPKESVKIDEVVTKKLKHGLMRRITQNVVVSSRPMWAIKISPDSNSYAIWNIISICFMLYECFCIPYGVGFGRGYRGTYKILIDVFADLFFGIDIILRCNCFGYIEKGIIEFDRHLIFQKYKKGFFLIDVIAWIPFDILPCDNPLLARALRIPHLLRLCRFNDYFKKLDRNMHRWGVGISIPFWRMVTLMLMYLLGQHWFACIWMFIHRHMRPAGSDTWANRDFILGCSKNDHEVCTADDSSVYVRALYFVIAETSTVGYGDIRPYGNLETWWNIVVVLMGACFFGGLIGSFQALFHYYNEVGLASYRRHKCDFKRWFKYRQLPQELQRSIEAHNARLWEKRHVMDLKAVLNLLPRVTQMEIAYHANKEIFYSCKFLRLQGEGMKKQIASVLEFLKVCAGDIIYEAMDVARVFYIISEGFVEASPQIKSVDKNEPNTSKKNIENVNQQKSGKLIRLGPGDIFGGESMFSCTIDSIAEHTANDTTGTNNEELSSQHSFSNKIDCFDDVVGVVRQSTMTAITDCDLYFITKSNFLKCIGYISKKKQADWHIWLRPRRELYNRPSL